MKLKKIIIEKMPGKTISGQPALRAFEQNRPKTWEASTTEEGALKALAISLGCDRNQLQVVKRTTDHVLRRMALWEDLASRLKDEFGFARA
jgi:hypothetical protein